MTFFLAWFVLPLLLAGIAFGCGRLVERLVRTPLDHALTLPVGFAVVLVVSSLTTMSAATAGLTTPLVVALAVAGIGLELPLRGRLEVWLAVTGIAVFVVYALPIVLAGYPTFAGYISLDDTATWFAFADNALAHGRSVAGLAPSSYEAVLHDNLSTGYPIGSMVPLGIGYELTGVDVAWLFQPYIAWLGALLSLTLYALVRPLIASSGMQALIAFVGAQAALLFAYAFWSGIKEVTVAYLLALSAALAASELRKEWRLRGELPLAIVCAALLVCLSVLGVIWFAGGLLFAWLLILASGARRAAASLGLASACALVLALPALTNAWGFVRGAYGSDAGSGALGNLVHPLSVLQVLGIWPTGDFRGRPSDMAVTYCLLGVLAASAAVGIWRAVRSRAWGLPLYAAVTTIGWLVVRLLDGLHHGSPWLDAKALASASPALLVCALTGAALVLRSRRAVGLAALAVIAGGVLWSNVLAYGNVWLAPRDQLSELQTIGARFARDGPSLMTEYQPYGVRHFLRRLDPEGASERRTRPLNLRGGGMLAKSQYADLDAFDVDAVLAYRTLVLRRSPLASRPPSVYAPVWSGRWYEVWQRPTPTIAIDHLFLGTDGDPNGVAACRDVLRLASVAAAERGTLLASERPQPLVFALSEFERPSAWRAGTDGLWSFPTTAAA